MKVCIQAIIAILFLVLTKADQKFQENKFIIGVDLKPHISKLESGGEDAYYVNNRLIAVADGVGGWNRYGIDPAQFSRGLCENIKKNWIRNPTYFTNNLVELMDKSHLATKFLGSSTLVLVSIDPVNPKINVSYIGDSGYMLFRIIDNKVIKLIESVEQQHQFNFPFQLAYNPQNEQNQDRAKDALNYTHDVQDGDILIVGSDGLFDNISGEQIGEVMEIVLITDRQKIKESKQTEEQLMNTLSNKLIERAYKFSVKQDYDSPFAQKARISLGNLQNYLGGKQDDITVASAKIKLSQNAIKQSKEQLNIITDL